MVLMALGVNYQTAALDVREKLAFDSQTRIEAGLLLVSEGVATEAVVVSTCNRTEIYCEAEGLREPLQFLVGHFGLVYEDIQPFTYLHLDVEAVIHLMRVASGLDSMVLGEVEILGQIKQAYMAAKNAGTIGKH